MPRFQEWWQITEAMVRKAAWEVSGLPGEPPMSFTSPPRHGRPWGLDREIVSTESPRGARAAWIETSPWKVYVFMECCAGPLTSSGVLGDTKGGWAFMDRLVKRLESDNRLAIEEAGWESYNPAVAYVWVRPRMIA